MDFYGVDEDESSIGITMRDKEREILERGNVVWRERERERERKREKGGDVCIVGFFFGGKAVLEQGVLSCHVGFQPK